MLDKRNFQATEKGKASDIAAIQDFAEKGLSRVVREAILGGTDRPVVWGLVVSAGPGNSNIGPVAQIDAGGVLTGEAGGFESVSLTVGAAEGLTAAIGADKIFEIAVRPARKGTDSQVVTLLEVATARMYPSEAFNKTDHAGVEARAFEKAAGGGSTIPAAAGWVKLADVTVTPGAGVSTIDQTMAPTLRALLRQHHTGEAGSAPKIDLTNGKEVQGLLPSTMIEGAAAMVNGYLEGAGPITVSAPDPETGKTTINMTRSATAQNAAPISEGGAPAVAITAQGEFQFTIPQGEQGVQGVQGIQGVQGLKGDKGDKGDTGLIAGASEARFGTFTINANENAKTIAFSSPMGDVPGVVIAQYKWTGTELPRTEVPKLFVGVSDYTVDGFKAQIIDNTGDAGNHTYAYIAIR